MTSTASAAGAQPGAALADEFAKLGGFVGLLRREQELLKNGDTETLLPLIEDKIRLANALAA